MVGVAVSHLIPEAFEVGFVELCDFDFVEFDFSFVVFYNFIDSIFEFVVVRLDQFQSAFFVEFQFFVDFQQSSDFIFLGCDDGAQGGDIAVVVLLQVGFPLGVGFSFLLELIVVEGSEFDDAGFVAVVVVFELVSEEAVVVDESDEVCFSFFAGPLESVVAFFDFMLLFFDFVVESLDFGFVQVLQLVFVFAVLSHQVVLGVFAFRFDQVEFVSFLLFHFF